MSNTLSDLLCKLIAIPSVNPDLDPDPARSGEARLAGFVASRLDALGFRVVWEGPDTKRPNLVATFGPEFPRKTLMLESHLDTVGVEGYRRPPFRAHIESGRVYGRGACDTKGPMAAALHALTPAVLNKLGEGGIRLVFVGAMGEENGNLGAEYLVSQGLRADEAIILEPTELRAVCAHKGAFWFEVEVGGTAAHGSNPDRGHNAILGMTQVIHALGEMIHEDQRQYSHPLLGLPTLNIGTIKGGTAMNIVPDSCVIEVDRRTLPGGDHDGIQARVEALLRDMERQGAGRVGLRRLIKKGVPFQMDPGGSLVRRLSRCIQAAGGQPEPAGAAWYSDAGPFSTTSPAVLVFGPGSIVHAHTTDEYIEMDSLQTGCDILRLFLNMTAEECDE